MNATACNLIRLIVVFGATSIFFTGCAYYAQLPTARQPISSRKPDDFAFVNVGHPSRVEVEAKLGKPDAFFPDLQVSVYPIDTVVRHKLVLLFFILPINYFRDYDGWDVACIEFDKDGRVLRHGIITNYLPGNSRFAAEEWLRTRDHPAKPR